MGKSCFIGITKYLLESPMSKQNQTQILSRCEKVWNYYTPISSSLLVYVLHSRYIIKEKAVEISKMPMTESLTCDTFVGFFGDFTPPTLDLIFCHLTCCVVFVFVVLSLFFVGCSTCWIQRHICVNASWLLHYFSFFLSFALMFPVSGSMHALIL